MRIFDQKIIEVAIAENSLLRKCENGEFPIFDKNAQNNHFWYKNHFFGQFLMPTQLEFLKMIFPWIKFETNYFSFRHPIGLTRGSFALFNQLTRSGSTEAENDFKFMKILFLLTLVSLPLNAGYYPGHCYLHFGLSHDYRLDDLSTGN